MVKLKPLGWTAPSILDIRQPHFETVSNGFRVPISDCIHKAHIFYIANMRIFIYKTMIH